MRSLVGALLDKAPVSYVPRRASILSIPGTNRSDPVSQMQAMGSVGTLFAVIHRLSNSTSQVEWNLWRKAESGEKDDREPVTSHAALDVWSRPNPFMPRQEFVEVFQQHLDLVGEGWWVIARNGTNRLPLELWPVRPDRMEPVPDPQDFIKGYIYMSPDGDRVPLEVNDVIQLRMPNPLDPYRGMAPVQAILTDIDASRYSAEWNRNFFVNSAEPGGIIEVDKRLSDVEFEELRTRWSEQHRGVANAHRVAILEAGKWIDRKFTQRDMQFTELRTLSRDVIREAFGIPRFALGDVEDVNRATAEASAAWFAEQLMVPRLERIKASLNFEFLPLFGPTAEGLEFDYEDPVPANREADNAELTAKANAAKTLVDAGYDPSAVLEAVGLPDILFSGAPAEAPTPPGPLSPSGPTVPSRRTAPPVETGARHMVGTHSPFGCASCLPWNAKQDVGAEATREREDWEDRVDQLVEDWEDQIAPDQFGQILDQIERIVSTGSPEDLAALEVDPTSATDLLADAMFAQATAAAHRIARLAASQGVSIAPVVPAEPPEDSLLPLFLGATPRPIKVVEGLAADLRAAAKIHATNLAKTLTAGAAREALRAWAPGAAVQEVKRRVKDYLEGLTTATLGSQLSSAIWQSENEGRFATLEEAEADNKGATKYVSDEIRDANTCPRCKEIDGHVYSSLADAQADYPFGTYKDCEGGDRCRGTIEPSWEKS